MLLTPLVDDGRELEAQAFAKRSRSLNVDVMAIEGSFNNLTLAGSITGVRAGRRYIRGRYGPELFLVELPA